MNKCALCPVKSGGCASDAFPDFCAWAATGDEVLARAIVTRSTGSRPAPYAPAADTPDKARLSVILAAVAACPDRGKVLPHTLQPSCGCAELTECRAGKGAPKPGVTLGQCVACRTPEVT